MDVFSAFPGAVVSGVWQLGNIKYSTETGKRFEALSQPFDVIVDEVVQASTNTSPDAEAILDDTLLYAKPYQVPTINAAKLCSNYLWLNTLTNTYFEIIEVGIGKNQETGVIEHLEFKLRPTGVLNG